jgi:hypothetical protein
MSPLAFLPGARVAIVGMNADGRFVVEGMATLVKGAGHGGRWIVHFEGDEPTRRFERFVDPAAQADPIAFVSQLNRLGVQDAQRA